MTAAFLVPEQHADNDVQARPAHNVFLPVFFFRYFRAGLYGNRQQFSWQCTLPISQHVVLMRRVCCQDYRRRAQQVRAQ